MTPELEWIEKLRKERGLAILQFCETCGLNVRAYYNWKNGTNRISWLSLRAISKAFDIKEPTAFRETASVRGREPKGLKERDKPPLWVYDGKQRDFCPRRRCEWAGLDGICRMPECLRKEE